MCTRFMNIILITLFVCNLCIQHGVSFTSPFSSKVATLKPKETKGKKVTTTPKFQFPTKTTSKKNEPAKEKLSFSFQSFGSPKATKPNVVNNNKKNSKQAEAKEKAPSFSFQSFGNSKPVTQSNNKNSKGKNPVKQSGGGGIKLPELKAPELKVPQLPDFTADTLPSPLGFAGSSMQLLKPIFTAEAKLQAGVLVNAVDLVGAPFRVYPDEIRATLKKRISLTKPVLYTYNLSPFSKEAKKILGDYDVEIIDVGEEWFFLGPEKSELRLALAENSDTYQTSLPHLFVKGESLGGLSTGGRNNAGILGLKRSGELDKLFKKKTKK